MNKYKIKKVGLLGGSFDPIHLGHLHLAFELQKLHGLSEVWFIPAQLNPHKHLTPPTSAHHRLEMVKCAISPFKNFHVKDLELRRPPPSYTIDTIKELKAEEPDTTFFLLLGEDSLVRFNQWHQSDEIVQLVKVLIGSRENAEAYDKDLSINKIITQGMTSIPLFNVSSSIIRKRLQHDLPCDNLLPGTVLDYIIKHHLYSSIQE